MRPHGLQPTRLLHPWDFPGKSTGVGAIAFSKGATEFLKDVLAPVFLSSSWNKPHCICDTAEFLDQFLSVLLQKDHLGFKHLASNMAVLNLSLRLECIFGLESKN